MRGRHAFGSFVLVAGILSNSPLKADITPVNYPTAVQSGSSVSGVVTNIDPVNQMVQLRDASGMVQTVRVDVHIQLVRNGEAIRLIDLNLGDTITAVSH